MYKLILNSLTNSILFVQRISDGAFIPFSLDNTDYQAYLLWCEQGNEPLPAENT